MTRRFVTTAQKHQWFADFPLILFFFIANPPTFAVKISSVNPLKKVNSAICGLADYLRKCPALLMAALTVPHRKKGPFLNKTSLFLEAVLQCGVKEETDTAGITDEEAKRKDRGSCLGLLV